MKTGLWIIVVAIFFWVCPLLLGIEQLLYLVRRRSLANWICMGLLTCFLLPVGTLQAGGLREGSKYQEHSKFSWPVDCKMAVTFNSGPGVVDWSATPDNVVSNSGDPTWLANADVDGSGVYAFDGDDKLLFGDVAYLDGLKALTFSTWVSVDAFTGDHGVISKRNNEYTFQIIAYNSGGNHFHFYIDTSAENATAESAKDKTTDRWYHVVGVHRDTQIEIFMDGEFINTSAWTNAFYNNPNPLALGAYFTDHYLTGKIGDARIFTRALSADEIRKLYLQGK